MKNESEFFQTVLEKSREYKQKRTRRIKNTTVVLSIVCTAAVCMAIMPKAFYGNDGIKTEGSNMGIELYFETVKPQEDSPQNPQQAQIENVVPDQNEGVLMSVEYNGTKLSVDNALYTKLQPYLKTNTRGDDSDNTSDETSKTSVVLDTVESSGSASGEISNEASTELLIITVHTGEGKTVYTLMGDEITEEIKSILGIG